MPTVFDQVTIAEALRQCRIERAIEARLWHAEYFNMAHGAALASVNDSLARSYFERAEEMQGARVRHGHLANDWSTIAFQMLCRTGSKK